MTTENPPALWTAAARGDDAALGILVRTYHDRVYRFGRRVCRDDYDADDAVQEAFIKLARRPDVIQHAGALSWLMTVVRNACLRMMRPLARQRRALSGEGLDGGAAAIDPQQALERWELVHLVHTAIASLERPYREVLILRDLEGLSGADACSALGLDLAAMKTRLHRARANLRQAVLRGHRPGSSVEPWASKSKP